MGASFCLLTSKFQFEALQAAPSPLKGISDGLRSSCGTGAGQGAVGGREEAQAVSQSLRALPWCVPVRGLIGGPESSETITESYWISPRLSRTVSRAVQESLRP